MAGRGADNKLDREGTTKVSLAGLAEVIWPEDPPGWPSLKLWALRRLAPHKRQEVVRRIEALYKIVDEWKQTQRKTFERRRKTLPKRGLMAVHYGKFDDVPPLAVAGLSSELSLIWKLRSEEFGPLRRFENESPRIPTELLLILAADRPSQEFMEHALQYRDRIDQIELLEARSKLLLKSVREARNQLARRRNSELPRKAQAATPEALNDFINNQKKKYGAMKAASYEFGISVDTIRRRLAKLGNQPN